MRQFCTQIAIIFSTLCMEAQLRPNLERRIQLLKQLTITEMQRMQIQQLIQEERIQQLWRSKRLQQILTPEQRKKLRKLKKKNSHSTKNSLN